MNTTFFHRSLEKRRRVNRIYEIENKDGICAKTPSDIEKAFIEYYQELLGSDVRYREHANSGIVSRGALVIEERRRVLCNPVTTSEIKNSLWAIGGEKAPGLDGFSSQFFKDNWEVIKDDVVDAVKSFFSSGTLLKQVNTILLYLLF